jgi:hypothetical protein
MPDEVAGNAGRSVIVAFTSTFGREQGRSAEAIADPKLILGNSCDYVTPRMDRKFGTFAPDSLDQSSPNRFRDRVRAVERSQLGKDDLKALFNCDLTSSHRHPDFAIRRPFRRPAQNLEVLG